MEKIDYSHSKNIHTVSGPLILLPFLLEGLEVESLLDVGAGMGSWLNAAQRYGVRDVLGLDGIQLNTSVLHCDSSLILLTDLRKSFNLERKFDVAFCFEVAEHLPHEFSDSLIASITRHTDMCFFGAAVPGQHGQNHVNCQWPDYWQNLFNQHGFVCADDIRMRIWHLKAEPWYKQNIFRAYRSDEAGTEDRILPLIHPEMLPHISYEGNLEKSLFRSILSKTKRLVSR